MATYWASDNSFVVGTSGGSTYITITVRSYGEEGYAYLYRGSSLVDYKQLPLNGTAQFGVTGLSSSTSYTWKIITTPNHKEVSFNTVGGNDSAVSSGCVYFDECELLSSSYSSSTGNITVSCMIWVYNEASSSQSATISYSIDGVNTYSQTISVSAKSYGAITTNQTIYVGKSYSGSSYTFNISGTITSSNSGCSGDSYSEYLTASWTPTSTRPDKFYWISSSSNLTKGSAVSTYITAAKWKTLQDNINAVRVYKGLSNYSFTTVSKGSTIKASYYNELAYAINAMISSSNSNYISTVAKGDTITAAVMNKLQTSINNIT